MYSSISSVAGSVLGSIRKDIKGAAPWYFDPLIRFAQRVPAFSGNMIELHFDRDHWFDFSLRINARFDQALIAGSPLWTPLSAPLQEGYLQLLNDERNGFGYGIENIWFEYDFPVNTDPSFFFDLHRNTRHPADRHIKDLTAVCKLFGYTVPAGFDKLLAVADKHQLAVQYYGLMFSRQPVSLRFTIGNIPAAQLAKVLGELGWQGDYGRIATIQEQFLPLSDKIAVGLDFNGQPGSRLGIEVAVTDNEAAVELLHRQGAFSKDQHQLLTQWHGKVALEKDVSAALTELHQREICYVHKRINHFKFILDNGQVTGKAYLYYCY